MTARQNDHNTNSRDSLTTLRQRAEEKAWAAGIRTPETLAPDETGRLIHELRVHQIELEMQNVELRRAQEALEASRERYFSLYDLAPVGYVTMDENGLIMEANLTSSTMLGKPRSALVRQQPLSHLIAPEDQDIYYLHSKQLFETGKPQVCELRMLGQAGALFWARLEATAARDKETGMTLCRVTISDITERKQAEEEREKLQAQFMQAQKMESVGRLAGGVAHDFNNMLSIILGYTELALKRVNPLEPLHADLEAIHKAGRRSADLTRQLLAFARKQTIAPKVLDLNNILAGMLDMLKRLIGEDIELVWQPGTGLWPVKIDPSQIDQILANLCVNARDAISQEGKIVIQTANITLDEPCCEDREGFVVPGSYVLLTVSDNGCGIDKEVMANIFEPFFTTKKLGQGTGLGLATVYGIVKQNHGFIKVDSKSQRGATFKIYLPRFSETTDAIQTETVPKTITTPAETVLLVEDEPMLLEVATRMLENLGYKVLTAGLPDVALALAQAHNGKIHLLIADVVLPKMNGRDLAKQITAIRPDIKCLFISGYTSDIIARCGVFDEGINFLQKPFTLQELTIRVREVLENRNRLKAEVDI